MAILSFSKYIPSGCVENVSSALSPPMERVGQKRSLEFKPVSERQETLRWIAGLSTGRVTPWGPFPLKAEHTRRSRRSQ